MGFSNFIKNSMNNIGDAMQERNRAVERQMEQFRRASDDELIRIFASSTPTSERWAASSLVLQERGWDKEDILRASRNR